MNSNKKLSIIFSVFIIISYLIFVYLLRMNLLQIFVVEIFYIFLFVILFFIQNKKNKKLTQLALVIEEMAAGNLKKHLLGVEKDEIGQVFSALNDLINRLGSGVAMNISMNRELAKAKTDFVSMASHQLRTPLSIIKWYSDYTLAGDAGKLNSEQKKYIKEIFDTNERTIDLVNALLDVSRIDLGTFSIEPEQTNIIEKANEAVKKYGSEIKSKKIIFEKQFDKMPKLNLDPRLTLIVLENILSNAIKYTPENGRVRFVIKKTDTNILIKISDTGVGITRELRKKMFSKMFRADQAKKMVAGGNGLGLYIAKAVVEKSGGKIWFESPSMELFVEAEKKYSWKSIMKKGMGTTFFVTIPLRGMKARKGTRKLESIK